MADAQGAVRSPASSWWLRPLVAVLGGQDATDGLWPIIGLTFVSNLATSGFYGYIGVWSITRLGATPGQVGLLLLANAALAIFSGYAGGACSDRIGRKPVLVWCLTGQALAVGACCLAGHRLLLGFALVVTASTLGTPAWAARTSLVPDAVPPERRSMAFSTVRTMNNVAVVVSPALVGALLAVSGWTAAFAVLSLLGLASAVYSQLFLPARLATGPGRARARKRGRLVILHDRSYLIILAATLMALIVYVAYPTVLPIVIVSRYGYSASTWGFLAIVNPAVVILAQGRLTRAVRTWTPELKVAMGILFMGLPWLLLLTGHPVTVIVLVILFFVCGEMLWAPASQAISADFAPDSARGAYQGAYGAMLSIALAVGPVISLSVLEGAGVMVMWLGMAAVAVVAAVLSFLAIRAGRASLADRPAPGRHESGVIKDEPASRAAGSDAGHRAWSSRHARPDTESGAN